MTSFWKRSTDNSPVRSSREQRDGQSCASTGSGSQRRRSSRGSSEPESTSRFRVASRHPGYSSRQLPGCPRRRHAPWASACHRCHPVRNAARSRRRSGWTSPSPTRWSIAYGLPAWSTGAVGATSISTASSAMSFADYSSRSRTMSGQGSIVDGPRSAGHDSMSRGRTRPSARAAADRRAGSKLRRGHRR